MSVFYGPLGGFLIVECVVVLGLLIVGVWACYRFFLSSRAKVGEEYDADDDLITDLAWFDDSHHH